MRTFHVQLLFQEATESYSIHQATNNNTGTTYQEIIRMLLKTKIHQQTKRNKNLLHRRKKQRNK